MTTDSHTRSLPSKWMHGICLVLVLLVSTAVSLKKEAYFGIVLYEGSANPFLGFYRFGLFTRTEPRTSSAQEYTKQLLDIASRFPLQRSFSGFTRDGQNVQVVIDGVSGDSIGDLDATLFKVRVERFKSGAKTDNTSIFFWTGDIRVQALRASPFSLAPEDDRRLRIEAANLYRNALDRLRPEDRPGDMILGVAVAERVEKALEVVAVQFPVILKGFDHDQNDDRASIFFIYNLPNKQSVFGAFGHPEWSTEATNVRMVKPLRYFVIGGDPNVYFVGEYFGAWEDVRTHAIFNLRTGQVLLESY